MGRTLYLSENRRMRVRRDGPSVLIESRDKAARRIPARLVGRVVVIGNVLLDAGAITLFAENDVPVVFMNHSGDEAAAAIPYNHRLSRHYDAQTAFLSSKETISRYRRWAETKRMALQVSVLKRIFPEDEAMFRYGLGEGNYREMISRLKPRDAEQWTVVNEIVANLMRGVIIEHLIRAGLDPHPGVIHRRHNLGLALDICHIMGAETDIQSIRFFKGLDRKPRMTKFDETRAVTRHGMRVIIREFEARRESAANVIDGIIDELFVLMRELRT